MAKTAQYVPLNVPRKNAGEDENVFVSINAKGYLIPKGKTTAVPTEVAYEYQRSLHALDAAEQRKRARRQ